MEAELKVFLPVCGSTFRDRRCTSDSEVRRGRDCFVSFDREHLVGNPRAGELPFPIGTAGDFLEWYREHLMQEEG